MSGSAATTLPSGVPASLLGAGADPATLYATPVDDANVLTVGADKQFATLAAAIAASKDGDVIKVDAGTYLDDTATINTRITIEGVGGVANLVATQPLANEKGILVTNTDVTIANVSFSGAAISSDLGGNAAGIRYQGGNLTLINDTFTGNQNGVLATPVDGLASNTVTIDGCTFIGNGNADPTSSGYGLTHNAYIGAVSRLTVTDSVFADVAGVGHELKSRATVNSIENNVIFDGPATASYSIDLPNGGQDTVSGNYIEKGANTPNGAIIHFGGEGFPYANSALTIQGNTIVNDRDPSGTIAVLNQTILPATLSGNTIANLPAAQLAYGPVAASGNVDGDNNPLADSTQDQLVPSNFQVITDGDAHNVVLTSSNAGVQGGAGLLTVDDPAGHVTVIGGSGGLRFTEEAGAGGSAITTAAGARNTLVLVGQDGVDSEGTDTITVGAGNVSILVNGSAVINSGPGSNSYTINGIAAVVGNNGSDFINVTSTGQVSVTGDEGFLELNSVGGSFRINAVIGGALERVSATGGSLGIRSFDNQLNFVTGGGLGQGAVIRLGAGTMAVQSNAADTIYAGSGNDSVQLSGGGQNVYATTGRLAIFGHNIGGATQATVYGNGGDYTIDGDTGNIIYQGGYGDSTVEAILSNITLVGGAGHLTINGGARDTITGGSGGITLNGGAADRISTAAGSANTLTLGGGATINSAGSDMIDAGNGASTITVAGTATITDASGSNAISVSGTAAVIATAGNETITVNARATANVITAAFTSLTETGATVAYTAVGDDGSASADVAGGSATLFSAADQTFSVNLGDGAEADLAAGTVNVSVTGAATVRAGAATTASVSVFDDGATIYGGSGALSVANDDFTAGHAMVVYGGSGSFSYLDGGPSLLRFVGGSGQSSINGAWGILDVTAGSGTTLLSGGSGGRLSFTAGSGGALVDVSASGGTITFGSGAVTVNEAGFGAQDIYRCVAGNGAGTDVINGFRIGTDQLVLSGGLQISGWSPTGSYDAGGGMTANATLSDGTQLYITGLTSAADITGLQNDVVYR